MLSKPNFDGDVFGKRLLVLLISTGLFLVTFRPPLPWKGEVGAWYDAEHVPDTEIDEARMYGARDTPHHGWPSWLLMLAGLTAMFAMSSPQKQTASISALRCVFGQSVVGVIIHGARILCGANGIDNLIIRGVRFGRSVLILHVLALTDVFAVAFHACTALSCAFSAWRTSVKWEDRRRTSMKWRKESKADSVSSACSPGRLCKSRSRSNLGSNQA